VIISLRRFPGRNGKNTGIGRLPSQSLAINGAWLAASLIAATLIAWLQLIALDGDLASATGSSTPPPASPAEAGAG